MPAGQSPEVSLFHLTGGAAAAAAGGVPRYTGTDAAAAPLAIAALGVEAAVGAALAPVSLQAFWATANAPGYLNSSAAPSWLALEEWIWDPTLTDHVHYLSNTFLR